ncbi:MAG: hypothetical protein ACYS0E_13055 [Planctomycetota bacterium]|jgi:hypothetical protein
MSDSIGNRSLLDFFKTFWPGVLGWGCIVAGLVVFEYLPVESPEDLRPLLIGLLLATVGSILCPLMAFFLTVDYRPARSWKAILVNFSPLIVFIWLCLNIYS